MEIKIGSSPYITYAQIAFHYVDIEDFNAAITYSKKALKGMFEEYKTSENEISTKGINNETLGACLYTYARALYGKDDISSGDYIMGLSANCNYEDAIDFCSKFKALAITFSPQHSVKIKNIKNFFIFTSLS